jgi:SAM-dependent methyltransferase
MARSGALMPVSEQNYWNDPNVAADLRSRQTGVTEFAEEFNECIPPRSRVLEIGCGAGDDAAFLANCGHSVTALDVSAPLIEIAAQRFADVQDLDFQVADIAQPLNVGGGTVDSIYARLSLHYFDHRTTLSIFGELAWVLKDGGLIFFACRSTEDPLYGHGIEIEPDMYELRGHVRHFFTPDYAAELLEINGFTDIEITAGQQELYGEHSAYVKCSARKSS